MKKYEYDKEKLPEPILKGREDFISLYYRAWELAFLNVDYNIKDNWKPFLTCMPGVNKIWQWDSCLMTFITNYSNGTIDAFNNIDILYSLRRESDGYMSMAYDLNSKEPAFGERINPPIMAWCEWEHYLVSGDNSRFSKVLPALEGFYNFIEKNRRRVQGLYWFEDPGSSGMDNSPRGGYTSEGLKGSDVCHVDLACQQAMSAKYISLMYGEIKNIKKKNIYEREHKRILKLINKFHWSDKTGFYYDFFSRSEAKSKVKLIGNKTSAAFWTLLAGAATKEKKKRLLEHIFNPEEFYTTVPFASLSKDDINYNKFGGYWLGGVWAPTNFAVIKGLTETGDENLAKEASLRYLEAICSVEKNKKYGSIWEAYAPEDLMPALCEEGEICRKDFVGWSGIAPITMLIENIIGIRFNANTNTVSFNVSQESGLKNMNFCGGKISIVCTKYGEIEGETHIEIQTQRPFTLNIKKENSKENRRMEVLIGKTVVSI